MDIYTDGSGWNGKESKFGVLSEDGSICLSVEDKGTVS